MVDTQASGRTSLGVTEASDLAAKPVTEANTPALPAWSILIATVSRRQARFLDLLSVVLPQAEEHGNVEVVACHNDGEVPLGVIRQHLLESARGVYVSFIDDDDMVPPDFIATIAAYLVDTPDIVGFSVGYYEAGTRQRPCYCSIAYEPHDDATGLYRDITHVQPIRRELALKGDFRVGWPEDNSWRNAVRPHVRTEAYIARDMYEYRHDWADSVQATYPLAAASGIAPGPAAVSLPRPVITSRVFRYIDVPQPGAAAEDRTAS